MISGKVELRLVEEFISKLRAVRSTQDDIDAMCFLLQSAIAEVNCSSLHKNTLNFIR